MATNYFIYFENTIYRDQKTTTVFNGAFVSELSNKPVCFRDFDQLFIALDLKMFKPNTKFYMHDMKMNGYFIVDWLERNGYSKALDVIEGENVVTYKWNDAKILKPHTYTCYIDRYGNWYEIKVGLENTQILFKDFSKILPFTMQQISHDFDTEHKYVEYNRSSKMNKYVASIDDVERARNNVLCLKECSIKFRSHGLTGDTIGSCALSDFRDKVGFKRFKKLFPNIYENKISEDEFGSDSIGSYVMKSYCGAFCYVNPEKKRKIIENGNTIDCNSLYPYMMHSISGRVYPVGEGEMHKGKAEKNSRKYFFQRFKCHFKLKDGYLPFIKIRNSYLYNPRECLESSDIVLDNGHRFPHLVELCLTQTELELFFKHYDVYDIEYLDYCDFFVTRGIFDFYIDYWKDVKDHAKNSVDLIVAKFMLNSLYGKFATMIYSTFKIPFISEKDDYVKMAYQIEENATPGYIPVGSAIISEARCFIVDICQKNYHKGSKGFCYSDSDSMHVDIPLQDIVGVKFDNKKLGYFKHETTWDKAYFARSKRYIEHVTHEKGVEVVPYHNIICAGLLDRSKLILRKVLGDELSEDEKIEIEKYLNDDEIKFMKRSKKIDCFKTTFSVPGIKLKKDYTWRTYNK